MTEVIESLREQDTYDLGKKLGENCKPGDIILLNGDLGVGKTVFTKGFGTVSYTHLTLPTICSV